MVMQSLTSGPKHDNPVGFSGARSNVDDDIKSEVVVQALVNIEGKIMVHQLLKRKCVYLKRRHFS